MERQLESTPTTAFALERFLCTLLGCEVVLCAPVSRPADSLALRLECGDRSSFWLSVDELQTQSSQSFAWLCHAARHIAQSKAAVRIQALQSLPRDGLRHFLLRDLVEQKERGCLSLPLGGWQERWAGALLREQQFRSQASRAEIYLWLEFQKITLGAVLSCTKLKLEEPQRAYGVSLLPPNPDHGSAQLVILEVHRMEHDEIESEEYPQIAQARLYLGSLQLDLDALINLQPGAQIAFERPEPFEASIELGGGKWAEVDVRFDQQQVTLTVRKVN